VPEAPTWGPETGSHRFPGGGRTLSAVRHPDAFRARLALIALAALALRTAATLHHRHYPVIGDALTFHLDAHWLATGHGFRQPFLDTPTAEHPPLFICLLALFDLLGASGFLAQKLLLGGVGTVTVVLVGLLGRAVAGERAGLIAAGLAAAYPLLWVADGSLMSETLYGVFVVASLLAAYGWARAPTPGRAALLGALIGLATLTRGEALLLVPLLGVGLLLRERALPGRVRLAQLAVLVAAFAVVMAPWTIRNLVTFKDPVLVSADSNGVIVGSNCPPTYYGPIVGLWQFDCYGKVKPAGDESQVSVAYRSRGLRYARHHLGRVPVVLAARLGRVWDVYRPEQMILYESGEGRPARTERLGVRLYWLLLPVAAAGLVLLRRRRRRVWILVAPLAMVSVTALLTYGSTRFRYAAEPALLVLAAVALDAAWRRFRPRPRPRLAGGRPGRLRLR
jgi:4-amino-4-deoxy-L-arabinose transferase-like glycosyltransferase